MIRIQNIPLPIGGGEEQLRKRAARLLGLNPGQLRSLTLARQSIDARKKSDVHYVCTVHVEVDNEARIMARCRDKNVSLHAERPYAFPPVRRTSPLPPVVVGMGPAGLFAALFLARNGVIPIVLERGRPVEERTADVERFWPTGVLDTTSNVQFGEGGAGTFSDGKLTTGTHDPRISTVLPDPGGAGAPADILYQHKPHIGTDVLRDVVRNRAAGAAGPGVRRALRAPAGGPGRAGRRPAGRCGGRSRRPVRPALRRPGALPRTLRPRHLPDAAGRRGAHGPQALRHRGTHRALRRPPCRRPSLARRGSGCPRRTTSWPAICPRAAAPSPSASVPAGRWWPPPRRRGGW